jgi:tight adherence protein C
VTAGLASWGGVIGLLGGLGLLLVLRFLPWRRRPAFDDRLAPYLRDTRLPSTLLAYGAGGRLVAGELVASQAVLRRARDLLAAMAVRLDRAVGGSTSIRLRVDQLGTGSLEQVRLEQLVWGGTALGAVLGLGLARAAFAAPPQPVALALLSLVAGLAAAMTRDRALTRAVAKRRARILAEFPTVAELLALSVAAGEGPVGALERVSRSCSGVLGRELGRTLADARAGAALVDALGRLADRAAVPVLRRFVDGIVVAVERGSPLAEVLRAQAVDVREAGRRELIETAARREVAMMIPVVFLVLPVSVVFALFPGFYGLTLTS